MSNFTTNPYITNPWITNPWTTNPWTTNPWVDGVPFEFTNTEATLDPYIEVTGTPEILWTWSDGSTSAVANPGEKTLTGTHTLLVTPWSAVTKLDFANRGLTGNLVTQEWVNALRLYFYTNSFSGGLVTKEWANATRIYFNNNNFSGELVTREWVKADFLIFNSNSFSGELVTREWVNAAYVYFHSNNFSSLSGSFQTQIKMVECFLQDNNISSQTEIDKLYADLLINAADPGRVVVCSVRTDGANMAAPSAAGLADIDDLRNLHGWTVTHA